MKSFVWSFLETPRNSHTLSYDERSYPCIRAAKGGSSNSANIISNIALGAVLVDVLISVSYSRHPLNPYPSVTMYEI